MSSYPYLFLSGGVIVLTRISRALRISTALVIVSGLFAAVPQNVPAASYKGSVPPASTATVAEAEAFMNTVEQDLQEASVRASRADWVQQNFITDDTETISAQAQEQLNAATTRYALESQRFDGIKMPADLARKFKLLKLLLTAPAPNNDRDRAELTRIATSLGSDYGKGKYCK